MAVISKIRRVANPARGGKSRTRRFASRLKRRKANPKMVRNRHGQFVKRKRTIKRRAARRTTNPIRRRRKTSTAKVYRRRRKRNPFLVELGMVNPRRRSKSVARKYRRRKTKANPRRRRAVARVSRRRTYRRRRTAVAVNPVRRRRRRRTMANPVRRYRRRRTAVNHRRRRNGRRYMRRSNPFGTSTKDMVTLAGGILVGVAAAKYIPTLLPAGIIPAGGNAYTGILITGAAAFAAGYIAHRFMPGSFANGVMAGGVALTLSQLLNAVAPPSLSSSLALSGMGDIIPGYYTIPQNPITGRAPVAVMPTKGASSSTGSGVGAFTGAFGGRR